MKTRITKIAMLLTIALALSLFTLTVSAAESEYLTLDVFTQAEVIDDPTTQGQGGNGTSISLMKDHGCGNSSLNDMVVFKDVDFGKNGAKSAKIHFGYGLSDGSKTKLGFILDDPNSDPILTVDIGFTGGWEKSKSSWTDIDLQIPAGKHTLYVKFMNDKSGSLSEISFIEAEAAPETTAAPVTTPTPSTTPTAAPTYDVSVVLACVAAGCAVAVTVLRKKEH